MQDRDPSSPRPSPRYIIFPVIKETPSQCIVAEQQAKPDTSQEETKQKEEFLKELSTLQGDLKKQLEENEKLLNEKNRLADTLKNFQEKLMNTEREKKHFQLHYQKQLLHIQNELKEKQQSLNETIDLLKKTQEELDYARKDANSINESYILEQKAHHDTCEELKAFSQEWADQFKQQADYFGNKLLQATNEIERLRNAIKFSINNKTYSNVVKDGLFKDNKTSADEKNKSHPPVKKL